MCASEPDSESFEVLNTKGPGYPIPGLACR